MESTNGKANNRLTMGKEETLKTKTLKLEVMMVIIISQSKGRTVGYTLTPLCIIRQIQALHSPLPLDCLL